MQHCVYIFTGEPKQEGTRVCSNDERIALVQKKCQSFHDDKLAKTKNKLFYNLRSMSQLYELNLTDLQKVVKNIIVDDTHKVIDKD